MPADAEFRGGETAGRGAVSGACAGKQKNEVVSKAVQSTFLILLSFYFENSCGLFLVTFHCPEPTGLTLQGIHSWEVRQQENEVVSEALRLFMCFEFDDFGDSSHLFLPVPWDHRLVT